MEGVVSVDRSRHAIRKLAVALVGWNRSHLKIDEIENEGTFKISDRKKPLDDRSRNSKIIFLGKAMSQTSDQRKTTQIETMFKGGLLFDSW